MKKPILSLILASLVQPVSAHEGHGEMPGMIKAVHGGTVVTGKVLNLEYVTAANEVKIYPLAHAGDSLNIADLKVSATAKVPKGKAENLKLESKEGVYYIGIVDLKKSHRAEVVVTTETNGKKDIFKFQVEK